MTPQLFYATGSEWNCKFQRAIYMSRVGTFVGTAVGNSYLEDEKDYISNEKNSR